MRYTNNQIGIKRKCGCCGEYLYINKNNINSMRAAQNAGFKLYGEVAEYNFEYRKYRP